MFSGLFYCIKIIFGKINVVKLLGALWTPHACNFLLLPRYKFSCKNMRNGVRIHCVHALLERYLSAGKSFELLSARRIPRLNCFFSETSSRSHKAKATATARILRLPMKDACYLLSSCTTSTACAGSSWTLWLWLWLWIRLRLRLRKTSTSSPTTTFLPGIWNAIWHDGVPKIWCNIR